MQLFFAENWPSLDDIFAQMHFQQSNFGNQWKKWKGKEGLKGQL